MVQLDEHWVSQLSAVGTYNFRQGGKPMTGWCVTLVPTIASDSGPVLSWCADHALGRDDRLAKCLTTRQNIGSTIVVRP